MALFFQLSACKEEDTRTAFEAFKDCNQAIRAATSEEEALACFTDEERDAIRDRRYGDIEPWLEMFRAERPNEPRLFREVPLDETIQLLIINGDGANYSRHIVDMTQQGSGRWRIGEWRSQLLGVSGDPETPPAVTLGFRGAVEWESEDLVPFGIFAPRCTVAINHVFDVASVHFPVKCDLLTQPGTYDAAEFLDPAAGRPVYVKVENSPNKGVAKTEDASLTVQEAPRGKAAGSFTVRVSHPDGDYTAQGTFENVPLELAGDQ